MSKKTQVAHAIRERGKELFQPGNSSHAAKLAGARGVGQSDFIIRSHKTYQDYWDQWQRFAAWAKTTHGINRWEKLIERRDELASEWLALERDRELPSGKHQSAWSLAMYRSALRMLFRDPTLAENVVLPPRRRQDIQRSRQPAKRDEGFSRERNRVIVDFARAVACRRDELSRIQVRDIECVDGIPMTVFIGRDSSSKGGKTFWKELISDEQRQAVAAALAAARMREPGRDDARLFERVPVRMDVHGERRLGAQDEYCRRSGRELPLSEGRLKSGAMDEKAAKEVGEWLGHGPDRSETVGRHYLR